jgi:hypothetical protein
VLTFLCICLGSPAFAEKVHITVRDAEAGQTVAARAYLRCGDRPVFPAGSPAYRRGTEEHFLLGGTDTFGLPAGQCRIEVARGLEYEPLRINFTVKEGLPVPVALRRWAALHRAAGTRRICTYIAIRRNSAGFCWRRT